MNNERPNDALQQTSGGPLARAARAPSSMRRSQLNAVFYGPSKDRAIVTTLVLLLLLTGSATASECSSTKAGAPATLVVQVVDELWLPLPGAVVSARLQGGGSECVKASADVEGIARLAASKQGPYTIEASLAGFRTRRVKAVRVEADASKSVPHVQIKLKVAAGETVI